MDSDSNFVEKVKSTNEISEGKIMEQYDENQAAEQAFVGVHLFVMQHGFQGNHNDMRLFKN